MKPRRELTRPVWIAGSVAAALLSMGFVVALGQSQSGDRPSRATLKKQLEAGNFKDALEGFRRMALAPADDPRQAGDDLALASRAFQELGRLDELDEFREAAVRIHPKNWRLLQSAANTYLAFDHAGTMVAGKFQRGKSGAQIFNATQRDRARALQLLAAAMPLADADPLRAEAAAVYLDLARVLLSGREHNGSWQLQSLTDLAELPDYSSGWPAGDEPPGAPIDADGAPIFYSTPKRWSDAANDGQRWRWALARAAELDPQQLNAVRMETARFFKDQFGVETLIDYPQLFEPLDAANESGAAPGAKPDAGPLSPHTLAEDETIARLASGVRRFTLPDESNFIKIYQRIAAEPQTGHAAEALEALATVFEDRQQLDRAADYWLEAVRDYGPGKDDYRRERLDQIVGNWGRFESSVPQPAGRAAKVDFSFRNGRQVTFEVRPIKLDKLLADIKAYLKSNPHPLDGRKIDLQDIGARIVEADQQQYVGQKIAAWDLELHPRLHHLDRRTTIATPIQNAGAYLLTAQMADGNTSRTLLWLDDTVIVKKPLADGTFYYVADAATGQPIAKANVELFGFRDRQLPSGKTDVETVDFADFTDSEGQLIVRSRPNERQFSWLVVATAPQSRFAFLGFTNIGSSNLLDADYNETKVFAISDRPVYRPGQTMKFKFWVRHAKYDQPDGSDFANQNFAVEIRDPKGAKLLSKTLTTDAYGGIDGEFAIPPQAALGIYQFSLANYGGGSFRVEEYKKPEFEVSIVAPAEPIVLGQKASATIRAKYYFGSPVTHGTVKYKILRSRYQASPVPPGDWDWLYGPGYWWLGRDCDWYPGWTDWGTPNLGSFWWGVSSEPPEVVAEREVQIRPDGTAEVEIDTALAKTIHPDQDHRYEITAEVTDASRQTVVGRGSVLAARRPFQVVVWVDRGYYHVGDVVRADCFARSLDGHPVRGDGKLSLAKIAYKDGKPQETVVRDWDLTTGADGRATLQIKASEPGQYRLSFKLTDDKKQSVEAAYLFSVVGQGIDGSNFRYGDLELIPDRPQYAPDQSVSLMVNTARPDSAVLLFVRPVGGVYLPPKLLRLTGKTAIEQIQVLKRDMPNFFVEGLRIGDGRVFSQVRQIIVPPESRVMNVAVQPSRDDYRPGQAATVSLKLTDSAGRPVVGSCVVAIYDKALDYISGGSNVENIKAFYWRWSRSHHSQTESSAFRWFSNVAQNGQTWMQDIGRVSGGAADSDSLGGGIPTAALPPDAILVPVIGDFAAAVAPIVVQPTVRSNFADTALWVGALETNDKGEAEVALKMPENLTTWKIKVWGMGQGTKVGEGSAEVVTRKDVIVRLEGPRFFVEKDEVVLSGNVHNYLKTKKTVQVALELPGGHLVPMADDLARTIEVPAGGESRVDWRVKVVGEGQATVRMKALTDEESDAVEQKFPVYMHGMSKMEAFSGALRPAETEGKIVFNVPAERRPGDSLLEVNYSPSLAGAMIDALPYLADFPYDCTEQTLDRFLPTVITQKILLRMGLDLKKIKNQRTNLNAQEIGDANTRAAGWKQFQRNPVFDNDEVARMVKSGVERLEQMQMPDGGWGWFSGFGEQSWPHTTATVVHGLELAKANDVALVPGVFERGVDWLKGYQQRQVQLLENALVKPEPKQPYKTSADNLDAFVYMVLVDAGVKNPRMMDFLYRDRVRLAVHAKALFGLALEKQADQKEKLAMILQNIRQYVVEDNEDQTAYLKLPPDNPWWLWYGSDIEADANYLKLLTRTDPKGALAPRLVKYLLNNRKNATYWSSTRDTALAIEALADYLRASGEDKPDETIEIILDGKKRKEVHVTAENLFGFDNKFVLRGDAVTTGKHAIELRKTGRGPLYYNAYLATFTLQDWIGRAGLEVRVNRKVYKLVRDDATIQVAGGHGQAVGERVEKYKRIELKDNDTLKSGDLVEVELEIDSKNDYEYLLFEDMKAAGFEPVEVRSGYSGGQYGDGYGGGAYGGGGPVGNALGAYMELRDNRVTFFVHELPRGKHSVSYRLRAEIPGRYSTLPARASAMYAPELKANSDEIKLQIRD